MRCVFCGLATATRAIYYSAVKKPGDMWHPLEGRTRVGCCDRCHPPIEYRGERYAGELQIGDDQ